MEQNPLTTALVFSGIAIVLLILALAALAGVVTLMTTFIKGDPEEEAGEDADSYPVEVETPTAPAEDRKLKLRAAGIAVAIARAQAEHEAISSGGNRQGESSSWRAYHRSRQLSQTVKVRRSS
jgi:Na+-transporting methylmalonyl-CoA/oxaloacetate decarboxylase gamma subunit